jgi:hypothetical protein
MSEKESPNGEDAPGRFVEQARLEARGGLLREYVDFLRHSKKWWLAPTIVLLLLIGVFVMLAGTVAAPLIYTLF